VVFLLIACTFAVADDCDGVLPEQAYDMLFDDPNTYIVDVRSPAEYYWVGHPETNLADDPESGILEGRVFHIPYKFWEYDPATRDYHMPINKFFARDVANAFPEDATLIFMCRSGHRSCECQHWLLDPGNSRPMDYKKILTFTMYNLDEGFEEGQRNLARSPGCHERDDAHPFCPLIHKGQGPTALPSFTASARSPSYVAPRGSSPA
jgi:rhodanese-related sulfurtransferase